MPHLDPGWRPTLSLALVLLLLSLLLRRRRYAVALREGAVVFTLYAAWCLIGSITRPHVSGAEARGRDVYTLERWLHLPSELSVQKVVLPHDWLAHVVNSYYLYGHLNVIVLTLAWTWWRHRPAYPAMRLQLIVLTITCELVQLIPVAPPRLLPELGFVDLANRYGESVYGSFGTGLASQLLAMPSLHVGWAALVAWTVWRNAPGLWRWVGIVHLVLMTLAVVASANHWWLDGIVAATILAVIVGVQHLLARRAAVPAVTPPPALVGAQA